LYLFTKKSRKRSVLNRKDAKDAKFKRQASIVQNRETVLDKDAFQFAVCPVKSEAFLTGFSRQIE